MARERASGRTMRATIDEMVDAGAGLEQIERELIDAALLGDDARAALWLYAWGRLERHGRTTESGRLTVSS